LLPLEGPNAEQGRVLLKAAEQAIADENKGGALPDGRPFSLAVKNETGSWGQSSSEMMRLITEDQSLALIIGPDGNLAHQAEQIANKLGVSIVTLASDATTTEINIPWIFRVVASDQQQAEVIARAIYERDKRAKVLLLATTDHDGRAGKAAFLRTMQKLGAPAPAELNVDPGFVDTGQIRGALNLAKANVVVFWTDSLVLEELLDTVQGMPLVQAIYSSEKAAQTILANPGTRRGAGVVRVPVMGQSTGQSGMPEQVYRAVRLIAAAIRSAGPNRARVRDALARCTDSGDGSEPMFDGAGNLLAKPQLVSVSGEPPSAGSSSVK
jgi:ABC-type branched-subunit amino acid transport system substrate-binding protein